MKFDISCKVYAFTFSMLLKKYYQEKKPDADIKGIIRDVKKEYKAMILRTPGLSKDNQMASNLKGAAYFFSMAKVIPDMSPELMDEMIAYAFNSDFMKKINASKKKKGKIFSEKAKEKMYQDSLRSQKSEDEMDWRYSYDKSKEDELVYTITKCGVCRLAERENVLPYLKCMCKMDYPKYKLAGGTLHRSKTLADHDDCCDFDIVKDK